MTQVVERSFGMPPRSPGALKHFVCLLAALAIR
jgi:hypothetical protein